MSDTAWDQLLDLIDHFAANPDLPLSPDVERTFATLCAQAIEDGSVDRELHVADTARMADRDSWSPIAPCATPIRRCPRTPTSACCGSARPAGCTPPAR